MEEIDEMLKESEKKLKQIQEEWMEDVKFIFNDTIKERKELQEVYKKTRKFLEKYISNECPYCNGRSFNYQKEDEKHMLVLSTKLICNKCGKTFERSRITELYMEELLKLYGLMKNENYTKTI